MPNRKRFIIITTAALLTALALTLTLLFSRIEAAPAQPPDFWSDQWAAECGSSTARDTVKKRYRRDLSYQCGSFTGAHTLWRVYVASGQGKETAIQYQMTVEDGLADLVLVEPDGKVTRLSGETSPYTFTPQQGETRLRVIGDKGKFSLELTIGNRNGQWME